MTLFTIQTAANVTLAEIEVDGGWDEAVLAYLDQGGRMRRHGLVLRSEGRMNVFYQASLQAARNRVARRAKLSAA